MRLFIIGLLISFNVEAAVWISKNSWNDENEAKYSQWIQSVRQDFVINKHSKYYGYSIDCADAIYFFRAIFSFENSLPFEVYIPHLKRRITNETDLFDKHQEPRRLKEFLNYIFSYTSTSTLRDNDTYPISISSLKPGDIYHYEIKKGEKTVRHAVVIKEILPNGNLSYFYATQAIKRNNSRFFQGKIKKARTLSLKENVMLYNKPGKESGGFRRFYSRNKKDYSKEQFSLSQSLSEQDFFLMVKNTLKKEEETLEDIVNAKIKGLCSSFKDRAEVVEDGSEYRIKIDRCMDFEEFDTYSTPMRDKSIKQEVDFLWNLVLNDKISLEKFFVKIKYDCPINIQDKSVNFFDVYIKFLFNEYSGDPHQSLLARWGLSEPEVSFCKQYY